jgi:hypothetical protein
VFGPGRRLNCSITVVIQGAIQYNKIVFTIEYYKSKVVKIYYPIRATLELTRQDVRIFYGHKKAPCGAFIFTQRLQTS